jgi:hypothetical protein
MRAVWSIVLLGVAGILVGGAVSLRRQGASVVAVALVGVLAALAAAGGILWLIPSS